MVRHTTLGMQVGTQTQLTKVSRRWNTSTGHRDELHAANIPQQKNDKVRSDVAFKLMVFPSSAQSSIHQYIPVNPATSAKKTVQFSYNSAIGGAEETF